jgi:hypothetical protein
MTRIHQYRIKFSLMFLLTFLICQNDLLAQRNDRFGLTFLDPKFPKKEPLLGVNNPKEQYLSIYKDMLDEGDTYSPHADSTNLVEFEINHSRFFNFIIEHPEIPKVEKARFAFQYAIDLIELVYAGDSIYHIRDYFAEKFIRDNLKTMRSEDLDFEDFDILRSSQAIISGLEVINAFETAANYASGDDRNIILIHLLDYAFSSRLLEYIFHQVYELDLMDKMVYDVALVSIPNYCAMLKESDEVIPYKKILMTVYSAYVETNYCGDSGFIHLTPAFNAKWDSDYWIGVELALDFSQHRYLYAWRFVRDGMPNIRISTLHFGMNFNLNQTSQREYYFGLLRFSHLSLFHLKLVQFGFMKNVPDIDQNLWFYRPQIGLPFGNFQLFYSFTQPLKKDYRQLIPRHAINLRIVFPYFRVNGYSNY